MSRLDPEAGGHLLVEGGEGGHRAHEDGELGDLAVLVQLEEVDSLQLAVADLGGEAQGNRVALAQLVDVGEVLQGRGDVGKHLGDDLAPLEAAEEHRAVEDDVLAQRVGEQVEVLRFGSLAEGMRVGHRPPLYAWNTRGVLKDRTIARISNSLGARGLRWAGKFNVPLYRLSGGRLGGRVGRAPVLLLTTTGRKSGESRTAPVVYLADGESVVVINTNAGNARVPAWSLNLKANPEAEVEVGRKRYKVRARIATGEERDGLWRRHNEQYAGFDDYQEKLDREASVVVLEPR